MRASTKPIRVFFSELSRRFYATRAYRIDDNGLVTVTGEKFDVTNDIAELIERHGVTFTKRAFFADGEPPVNEQAPLSSALSTGK